MSTSALQCRCGFVQLDVSGPAIAQFFCHCDDCQALHGAAYVPESVYPADAVHVTHGSPFSWTLKHNPRFGCPKCGTRLFIQVVTQRLRGVNGYLLPASEFNPTFHMHCRFAVRPVVDQLPHYAGRPARFGGTDDVVDW